MNNGKRSINISLGGGQGSVASSNPFTRSSRPSLGFEDDDGELSDSTPGPPKRKLVKLDQDGDDDNDVFSRLAPKQLTHSGPPQRRVDDDDDAFSRLASNKGMATIHPR